MVGNPTNPRGIIVVYTDIFSHGLPNNLLIADAYAKSGEWLVYMPDFFRGDPVKLSFADVAIPVDAKKQSAFAKYGGLLASLPSFLIWLQRHKFEPTNKICMDFLEALRRATPKTQKIGMVGMCWGGRYALRAGTSQSMIEMDGKNVPLVDAVVALHPSNLSLPADVENPVVPMSIGWGKEDEAVSIELKGKVEQIHSRTKALPEILHKVYEPGRHGFSVRGNPDDPAERKCLEDSVTQVLDWFGKYL